MNSESGKIIGGKAVAKEKTERNWFNQPAKSLSIKWMIELFDEQRSKCRLRFLNDNDTVSRWLPEALRGAPLLVHQLKPDPCVYFLLRGSRVVYVGQSTNLTLRCRAHLNDEKDFDRVVYLHCPDEQLVAVERAFINFFRPELNATPFEDVGYHETQLLILMGVYNFQSEFKNQILSELGQGKSWRNQG